MNWYEYIKEIWLEISEILNERELLTYHSSIYHR